MIRLLLSQLSVLMLSYALVRRLWPVANLQASSSFVLRACLVTVLTLGISSLLFFLALTLDVDRNIFFLVETALCLAASATIHRFGAGSANAYSPAVRQPAQVSSAHHPLGIALALTLIVAASLGCARFAVHAAAEPHGRWDAYAIWNLRARFLARGDTAWQAAFDDDLTYAHIDYPLLLPATVASMWNELQSEPTLVPRAVALAFTIAGCGLLVGGLIATRNLSVASLAGLAMLAGKEWIDQGWTQYADVPLAAYILATLVLLAVYDQAPQRPAGLLILAGISAGCAAWTKNEGCLFVVCLVLARIITTTLAEGLRPLVRQLRWIAVGLSPALAVLILFKLCYAGSNDLVENQSWQMTLARLSDATRYHAIVGQLAERIVQIPLPVVLGLGLAIVACGLRPADVLRRQVAAPALCLIAMSLGYFVVYLTTPHDLAWHLRTSLDRILLHIYPAALFTYCLALRTPEEALATAAPAKRRLPSGA